MRFAVPTILVLLALVGVAANEWVWSSGRPPLGQASASPLGLQVAQARMLDEGDPLPYGVGVYLHSRWQLFPQSADLVFTGYCQGDPQLHWSGERALEVDCIVAEGTPSVLPNDRGIVVTITPHTR